MLDGHRGRSAKQPRRQDGRVGSGRQTSGRYRLADQGSQDVQVAAHDGAHPRQQHRVPGGRGSGEQLDGEAVAYEDQGQVMLHDLPQAHDGRHVGGRRDGTDRMEELLVEAVHEPSTSACFVGKCR